MAKYERMFAVSFGGSKISLTTVGYEIHDSNNAIIIPRTQQGVIEVGGGSYAIHAYIDYGFIGYIKWDTGEITPIYATEEINDIANQVWNGPDRKLSNQRGCNNPIQNPDWPPSAQISDTSTKPTTTQSWPISPSNTNQIPKPPTKW